MKKIDKFIYRLLSRDPWPDPASPWDGADSIFAGIFVLIAFGIIILLAYAVFSE